MFDADNHFYERHDAFTRYIDSSMKSRCVQWVELDGKKRILIGGKIDNYILNPEFLNVPRPGSIYPYTYGNNPNNLSIKDFMGNLIDGDSKKEFYYLSSKIEWMNNNNIESAIMYPTYGLTIENWLFNDKEALYHTINSFNKWIIDEWTLNYKNRLFTAPIISLIDPNLAVKELEYLLSNNLKIICLSPDFVKLSDNSGISPTDDIYDDFWKLIDENNIIVGLHANDSWNWRFSKFWGDSKQSAFKLKSSVFSRLVSYNEFHDFIAKLLIDNFFEKFKNIKFITSESGSDWVYSLFNKLELTYKQNKNYYFDDPIKIFKEHIFVSPFAHENIQLLSETIGPSNIVFSSDYPHTEGVCDSSIFLESIKKMDKASIDQIMYENCSNLFLNKKI